MTVQSQEQGQVGGGEKSMISASWGAKGMKVKMIFFNEQHELLSKEYYDSTISIFLKHSIHNFKKPTSISELHTMDTPFKLQQVNVC